MSQIHLLQDQLHQSAAFIDMLMRDVTDAQAHWAPPGVANPIGATFAHVLIGEDSFVAMLSGGVPLFAAEWAGRLGVSELPPPPFPPQSWYSWGRNLRVDVAALRAYSEAVYSATDQWLGKMQDSDLERTMDFGAAGFGEQTMAWVVSNGVLAHRVSHWGELCCLRGMQGERGFPV